MKIKSVKEAFNIIENNIEGIPFHAIEYLRKQKPSKVINEKIIYYLKHAYDLGFFEDNLDYNNVDTVLWYTIVAEKHISKELIKPIVNLYTRTEDTSDLLNEQGMYITCLLAEKYPEEFMEYLLKIIDASLILNPQLPVLYLFDVIYYIDINKYGERLLGYITNETFYWKDVLSSILADIQYKKAIPVIKKRLNIEKDNSTIIELKESLNILETGENPFKDFSIPYKDQRGNWKEYYKKIEENYYDDEFDELPDKDEFADELFHDIEDIEADLDIKPVGRNDLCPCGSGKKFKKCCMN